MWNGIKATKCHTKFWKSKVWKSNIKHIKQCRGNSWYMVSNVSVPVDPLLSLNIKRWQLGRGHSWPSGMPEMSGRPPGAMALALRRRRRRKQTRRRRLHRLQTVGATRLQEKRLDSWVAGSCISWCSYVLRGGLSETKGVKYATCWIILLTETVVFLPLSTMSRSTSRHLLRE